MASISSVTATPGYFPEAAVTITGTGFGGSQGGLYIVWPNQGLIFDWVDPVTWSATSISGFSLPMISTDEEEFAEVFADKLGQPFFYVVVPVGETVGARSATYTFTQSTVPVTSFPNLSIVMAAGAVPGVENAEPFNGPVGFIQNFDNPGYTVRWYTTPDDQGQFTADDVTSGEENIVPLGTSVLASMATLGYSFSTEIPA